VLRGLRADPPDAVVISLERLPSQGKELAWSIRNSTTTRGITIVFAGGKQAKVDGVRSVFPDAVFTAWDVAEEAVREAHTNPPGEPIVPDRFYASNPLWKKLGIKAGDHVGVFDPPPALETLIPELPQGSALTTPGPECAVTLWFVVSASEL